MKKEKKKLLAKDKNELKAINEKISDLEDQITKLEKEFQTKIDIDIKYRKHFEEELQKVREQIADLKIEKEE